ncbi:MAG: NTP transferase domain-containing protein [Candidatus Eremiobacteraeota bacterium]|nr:NTP transferase domain-containing protein [Candidatus Eremiobacteraeota bacterium]
MLDAVITAAGRLDHDAARQAGAQIKALARIGGRTLLAILVDALRAVPAVGRITVVGPQQVRDPQLPVDRWLDERESGEQNVIAALETAESERALICASDLPFITAAAIAGLIALVPDGVACAYPVFTRAEFCAAFPGARTSFARLADGEWTGGSVLVVEPALILRDRDRLRRAFAARKNLLALAALFGPRLTLLFLCKRLRIRDVESRLRSLSAADFRALRGADPALAMDCDDAADFAYARSRFAEASRARMGAS